MSEKLTEAQYDEARKLIREKLRSVSFASANNFGLTTREIDEETDDLLADLVNLIFARALSEGDA